MNLLLYSGRVSFLNLDLIQQNKQNKSFVILILFQQYLKFCTITVLTHISGNARGCFQIVPSFIFKHRNLIVDERYKGLMNDLSDLHYLKILANIVRRKLNSKWNMLVSKCLNIFKSSGFKVFTKWQVFNNAPGYANTNSPFESFNTTLN